MEEEVIKIIDDLRPFLMNDGGNIEFVKLEDTLDSVEAIISGQFNHIPESTFAFVGGLSEVIEKFNSTQQVNVQQQVLK